MGLLIPATGLINAFPVEGYQTRIASFLVYMVSLFRYLFPVTPKIDGREKDMKTLSFKIEEDLHQGLKIGAAMEGRAIADVLKDLIREWVIGRDPFIHQLKTMPITSEADDLSREDLADIEKARKGKRGGSWEELSKKIPLSPRK